MFLFEICRLPHSFWSSAHEAITIEAFLVEERKSSRMGGFTSLEGSIVFNLLSILATQFFLQDFMKNPQSVFFNFLVKRCVYWQT